MNIKDISEIKRTLNPDRNAISGIAGCYVNANGEIISKFYQSFGLLFEDEADKYLSVFKHTLSGNVNRNLFNLNFPSNQVPDGKEYSLLAALKRSELKDEAALDAFYEKVKSTVSMEDNYAILLTYNSYDIPFRSSDGEKGESKDVYSYILCAVCPVKNKKSALSYKADEKMFRGSSAASELTAPVLGFLFPAFDDRRTNIHSTLFFTKSIEDAHNDFTDALFKTGISMPAATEGQTFRTVLAESLEENCSFDVIKNVHNKISDMIELHKASKEREPLVITETEVKNVLEDSGVPKPNLDAFSEKFSSDFGSLSELTPKNIVSPNKFELKTPDVLIKVAPGHSDMVDVRVIDGVKYILVRAEEGVELNGLNITI